MKATVERHSVCRANNLNKCHFNWFILSDRECVCVHGGVWRWQLWISNLMKITIFLFRNLIYFMRLFIENPHCLCNDISVEFLDERFLFFSNEIILLFRFHFCSQWEFTRKSMNGRERHRTVWRAYRLSISVVIVHCGFEQQQLTLMMVHGNAKWLQAISQLKML